MTGYDQIISDVTGGIGIEYIASADVVIILEENDGYRAELADYIIDARPELKEHVDAVMQMIAQDDASDEFGADDTVLGGIEQMGRSQHCDDDFMY